MKRAWASGVWAILLVAGACGAMALAEEPCPTPPECEMPDTTAAPVPDPAAELAARLAKERAALLLGEQVRAAIQRLGTPGWQQAQTEIIAAGKGAVPILIEALGPVEKSPYPANGYPVMDPRRPVRNCPLNQVVYEVLCNLIRNHSSYAGALPGPDRAAWEEFWTKNAAPIEFGK